MCIQIYRRCLCAHKEAYGAPKRCEKAEKARRNWLSSLAGPKLDRSGYCSQKISDSFGVPEPCMKCKAEGGYVIRRGASTPIERREANKTGQASSYSSGGGSSHRAGRGAHGQPRPLPPLPPQQPPPQAPLPPLPPQAYNNSRHTQVPLSRSNAETQQPQTYNGRPRRPTRYEDPRPPPPRPWNASRYVDESDDHARKQSEKHIKQTFRDAEKVSRDSKKKKTLDPSDSYEYIRSRAVAQAKEDKRRPDPLTLRKGSDRDRPAPLNIPNKKNHHHHHHNNNNNHHHDVSMAAGSSSREPVYPDLRHHPAMKADVDRAVHHEAFTTRVYHGNRQLQHDRIRHGAASHPDTYRREPVPVREQYATKPQFDYYSQPYSYDTPLGRFRVDENGVSPVSESPKESEISAFNVTQKLPYNNHQRR